MGYLITCPGAAAATAAAEWLQRQERGQRRGEQQRQQRRQLHQRQQQRQRRRQSRQRQQCSGRGGSKGFHGGDTLSSVWGCADCNSMFWGSSGSGCSMTVVRKEALDQTMKKLTPPNGGGDADGCGVHVNYSARSTGANHVTSHFLSVSSHFLSVTPHFLSVSSHLSLALFPLFWCPLPFASSPSTPLLSSQLFRQARKGEGAVAPAALKPWTQRIGPARVQSRSWA